MAQEAPDTPDRRPAPREQAGQRRPRPWATAALSVLLAAAAAFFAWQADRSVLALEAQRQRSLAVLVEHVENMQIMLAKGAASSTPGSAVLHLSQAWHHARAAQSELGQLPLPAEFVFYTGRFLTQTGDFALTLAKEAARGREVDPAAWQNLRALQRQAEEVAAGLLAVHAETRQGFRWARLHPDALETRSRSPATAADTEGGGWPWLPRRQPPPAAAPLMDSLGQLTRQIEEYPGLIYDGAFSAHLETPVPKGPPGTPISAETARNRAFDLAGLERPRDYVLQGGELKQGPIPAYNFILTPGRDWQSRLGLGRDGAPGEIAIDVTRAGGNLLRLIKNHNPGPAELETAAVARQGSAELRRLGFPMMQPVQILRHGGSITVQYAPVQDGVLLYPDLVKVQLGLDGSGLLAVDAWNYWLSHRPRQLDPPALTAAEAQRRLHPALEVVRQNLVLIPLETGAEVLAYEFEAWLGEQLFRIYIGAHSGDEEQVLRLIETPEGWLAL